MTEAVETSSHIGKQGLVKNLFTAGTTTVISRLLTLATLAYTARVLNKQSFGLLSFGTAVSAYAAILVGPGFLLWGTRAVALEREKAGHFLGIINFTQLFLAGFAYLVMATVAIFFFDSSERKIALLSGLSVFAVALSVDWVGQGLEQFKLIGYAQIFSSSVSLVLTIVCVKLPADVFLVPVITTGVQLLFAAALFALLQARGLLSLGAIEWSQWTFIARQALPLGISVAMITVLRYATTLALQFYRGSTELGIFGAAWRLLDILAVVPGIVSTVFLPRIARSLASDPVKARNEMFWYVQLVLAMAFVPAVSYFAESKQLIAILYGAAYADSANLLRLFGLAVVFNFAAVVYITGLVASKRDKAYFGSILAAMLLSITGSIFLVPRYGVQGAAMTVLSLDIATALIAFLALFKDFGFILLKAWVRPLASAGIMLLFLLFAGNFRVPFLLRLPAAIILYCAIVVPWQKLMPVLSELLDSDHFGSSRP